MNKCDNCDRQIGRLEAVHSWDNHVVCEECFGRLSTPAAPIRHGPIETRPQIPAIFKVLAWLLVIIILYWLVMDFQQFLKNTQNSNQQLLDQEKRSP
jgi:hypothetical protein